ncbi:MAG: hypothetical protein J6T12_03175 [Salinivirgaceae bacterium]|nr:hypothetical protein [Salinivirgaceae bacterium]
MKDKTTQILALKQIFAHYGTRNQISKLHEEQGELIDALYDMHLFMQVYEVLLQQYIPQQVEDNKARYTDHVAEEIADNLVLMRQFMQAYGISQEQVEQIAEAKINRQIGRIEKELSEPKPF